MSESNNQSNDVFEDMFKLLFGDLSPEEQTFLREQLGADHGVDCEGDPIPKIAMYKKGMDKEQVENALQSLNCEHMAAHYGGMDMHWFMFDEYRYAFSQYYTDRKCDVVMWERYTVVVPFNNGVTRVPILFPHVADDHEGFDVVNTMNFSDCHVNPYVFGVYITIMVLTAIAEKVYAKSQGKGMLFYNLRNAVITLFRDGYCYGVDAEGQNQLNRLID